jgi:hypothetical protein
MSVRGGMPPMLSDPDADLLRLLALGLQSKTSLAAENLFLRKQLSFYQNAKSDHGCTIQRV